MTNQSTPVAVAGGLTFADVSVGSNHTCGVASAGVTYCWGSNISGQLGDGTNGTTTPQRSIPGAVTGGLTFSAVSDGGNHTCGVTPAGAAYCWGGNAAQR